VCDRRKQRARPTVQPLCVNRMETNILKFNLPRRVTFSLIIIIGWAQTLWFIYELTPLIITGILINIALPLFIVWGTSMSISNKGIALYYFNKLAWPDIIEAHEYKVAGLPYVRIKRKKGMSWA